MTGLLTRGIGWLLRGTIRAYQLLLSPLSPPTCRYLPTCSQYAIEAVAGHGPLLGIWLTAKRVARCHPWSRWGYDPVPDPATTRPRAAKPSGGH